MSTIDDLLVLVNADRARKSILLAIDLLESLNFEPWLDKTPTGLWQKCPECDRHYHNLDTKETAGHASDCPIPKIPQVVRNLKQIVGTNDADA